MSSAFGGCSGIWASVLMPTITIAVIQRRNIINTGITSIPKSKKIYHDLNGVIGHRSMKVLLDRNRIHLSKTTLQKYMNHDLGLQCICRKRKTGYCKEHAPKIFPNLLNQKFFASEPNRIWCTDFTFLFLTNGSLRYNCTTIDLYDRSVVASENGKWITSDLAIRTAGYDLLT